MTKPKAKPRPRIKPHGQTAKPGDPVSEVRTPKAPRLSRNVWLIGFDAARLAVLGEALKAAGHEIRTDETSNELAPNLRDFRPDLIVVDMQDQPERGRHTGQQLRADRVDLFHGQRNGSRRVAGEHTDLKRALGVQNARDHLHERALLGADLHLRVGHARGLFAAARERGMFRRIYVREVTDEFGRQAER